MELRHTRSLSTSSLCDQPTSILPERSISVSQLVARYQMTPENHIRENVEIKAEAKPKQKSPQMPQQTLETKKSHLEALGRGNEDKDQSPAKTSLARSKSVGSLQNKAVSIQALKARFESKEDAQKKEKTNMSPSRSMESTQEMTEEPQKISDPPLETKESLPKALEKKDDKQQPPQTKTSLVHGKSTGSLGSSSGSIGALRACFESKVDAQNTARAVKNSLASTKPADITSMNDGEAKQGKKLKETPKSQTDDPPLKEEKDDRSSQKEVTQQRRERRKTIGGIDFEKMVAIKADEKRKSFAGFSDSLLDQNKDRPSVSVKAISALLLSKVAAQEPTNRLSQSGQEQSGRTFKPSKMADDSQQTSDDPHPPVPSRRQPYDSSDSHFQPVMVQDVKGKLHQQRQKCELRRLLKHTYPELKRLDDVLDEELAEVLSSDTEGAAGESGYEGEVLSRCLIFENCATTDACFPPRQPAERSENSKTAKCEMQEEESVKHAEEDDVKIDVRATRRIFEGQSVSTSRQNAEKSQRKVSSFEDKREKSKEETKSQNFQQRNTALTGPLHPHSPEHEFCGTEDETSLLNLEVEDKIKTSAALLKNNPFITANIGKESKSHNATGGEHQECLTANVKKRAYLFESLPFDKIKHQNKDEVEAMVENIRGTLNCLYCAKVIHSGGSIVEVSETMMAKKATFTLSDVGPLINDDDEVAEGGAQNFILQLVPRAHLKPRITYLKEDKKGTIEATIVNVGFHQETECKTAQLVQVVEDILHQDNSLRKGIIIQKDVEAWAEVMVYSLYKYFDEEDVKSYCPPQIREYEELQPESGAREPWKREADSLMCSSKNTPKDQTLTGSIRPEITAKGNVKLFKSCIEKGDLEYLKAFHVDSTVEEVSPMNNVAAQGSELHPEQMDNLADVLEWVPVDVGKLKKMFSGDRSPTQPKQKEGEPLAQRSAGTSRGQNMNLPSTGCNSEMFSQQKLKENSTATTWQACTHLQTQDDHVIHKAELAKVVGDCDEISNLQFAINALQQATIEAKTLHEKQKSLVREATRQKSDAEQLREETLPKESKDKEDQFTSPKTIDYPSACDLPAEFNLDLLQKNTEENHKVTNNEAHSEPCSGCARSPEIAAEEQEGEVIFQGKLQAALESLERSNINVTRGDFKAAMIYRNSSKIHKKPVDAPTQAPTKEEIYPFSEPQSVQGNADTSRQGSAKICRSVGPKPAIPPKPERMKLKGGVQSTNKSSIANLECGSANLHTNQLKDEESHQVKGSIGSTESNRTEEKIKNGQQNFMVAEENPQGSAEESMTETNKPAIHFYEECQKMDKKSVKNAPIKPKRVKVFQADHKTPKQNIEDTDSQILTGILVKQGSNVELREKKGRSETEDERRQRLSVHMDEIVNGNIAAAMEIFDNLRKQEELQSILSRVEEIEKDTSGVDVRSLRGIFENVPDWVVSSDRKKPNKVKDRKREERMPSIPENAENKTSMAHVFGNLERASEEILNLKEQTLSRLMDIEEAIKKALYSVSTLKSESDIAGLSSLFKESYGTVQGSPASANISKISVGSCRAKPVLNWESPAEESTPLPGIQAASSAVNSAKPQSPSPTFISIQSAARQAEKAEVLPTCLHSPKKEEKFLTTATLTCKGERKGGHNESCHSPKRELSVLEVRTDHEGNTITVTGRTDPCGNKLYSSTDSTVITAPLEASTI